MFQNMFLEQEQKDLLATLVEASRNVASNQREPFMFVATMDGSWIQHRGLQSGKCEVYQGDLQILKDLRLISIVYSTNHMFNFDVSPLGFRYYEEMKKQQGMPTLRIEGMLKSHLDARRFQSEYKIAYQKWSEAEAIL